MTQLNQFSIPTNEPAPTQADNGEVHIGGDGKARVSVGSGVEVRSSQGGNGASGIFASARSASGQPVGASSLQLTDTIDIGGQRLTVKVAERMGLIQRNANTGLFEDGGLAGELASQPQDQSADDQQYDDWSNPKPEPFIPETENFVAMIPQTAQASLTNDIAITGTVSQHTIEEAASRLGVEPEQAQEYLSAAVQAYSQQASAVLAEYGVSDGRAFAEWAMKARPGDWKEAVQRHQTGRTTVGYRPLAREYLAHLHDVDPQSVAEGVVGPGVSARLVGKTVYVRLPGVQGEMPFKAAVKAGFVGRGR